MGTVIEGAGGGPGPHQEQKTKTFFITTERVGAGGSHNQRRLLPATKPPAATAALGCPLLRPRGARIHCPRRRPSLIEADS